MCCWLWTYHDNELHDKEKYRIIKPSWVPKPFDEKTTSSRDMTTTKTCVDSDGNDMFALEDTFLSYVSLNIG